MNSHPMHVSESTNSRSKEGIYIYQGSLQGEPKEIRTSVHWEPSQYHSYQRDQCLTIWMKPVPKPRETQKDRWTERPSVMRFRFFRDVVRAAMEHFNFVPNEELGLNFYMQMPKMSKTKTAQRVGRPHRVRPDIDNLEKATLDSLFQEDSVVWRKVRSKGWSYEPRIEIWNLK